ncbi:MAG: Ig-like domain-containing protein [Myxococcales bacterium]|jgi:adhesin/invasin
MRARIACGIAILLLTACGEKPPPQSTDAGTQTMIDVRQSTVVAEPDKDVVADGETRSTITVTIKDIAGQPLPDFQVLLAAQGEGASITQPGGPTDANGIAVGFVTATKPGTVTISAKASNATNTYDLPSQAQVLFVTGEAKKLVFQVPPSAAQAGTTISPAIRIAVQDDFGNTLDSNIEVTVALGENPGGGTLSGTLTVAADKGTATFEDLRIDKAASGYTLVASAVGLESVASEPFEITAGAPASLSFLDVPASTVAGAAFDPPVRVAVLDPQGNLIPNATNIVTVALGANPGQATLAGTLSVRANAGIATFSDLKLTKAATGYELVATASGLAGATSEPFIVAPAAPARLGFVVHPSTVTAGAAIAPAVQVAVEDEFGNRVTEASTTVTVALGTNPGTATLSGTTTVETAGGIATFDSLSLDKAARGYVLAASADGLTTANSNPFEVVAALPFRLSFLSEPTNTEAGATISPAVRVLIEDAYGNTVTGSELPIALAIGDNPGNGTLTGTQLAYPTAGIATFPDLKINKAGIGYTLVASAMGSQLPTTTSAPFDIIPAAPIAISFPVQPSDVAAGSPITPAVEVSLLDRFDNLVTYATNQITLALGANPGNGHLLGTLTVGATGGVASFADLRIDRSASGYTLVASTSGLPSVTSEPFEVTGGAASRLAFVQQPSQATSNQPIAPPVQVEVLDAFGNRLLTATDAVTLSLEGGATGAILSGTKTVTPVNGVASFADLSIDKAGTGYALRARASGLIGATSTAFSVVAGAPSSLAFLVQPQLSIVNQAMRPIMEVAVFDSAGNLTSGSHPVTMSLASNPTSAALNGATTVGSVNGVASFQDLSVSKVGSGYTLSASLNGVPSVTSDAFDVISGTASKLAFSVQPSNTVAGEEMAPVEVRILDAFGNLVPSATHAISLAVGTGPGALLGNTTVVAANGVAVFPGLRIERAASGYTVVASASGLTNDISNPFNITPAAVSASVSTVLALPVDNVVADNSASATITVTARDAFGNPVPGASVTLAATGDGNTLAQPTAVTNASGVATGSIKSTKAETKTITATVGATILDARPQVRFVHGAPSASVSTVRASAPTVVANGQATSTITVTVLDAYSNPVSGASVVLASSGSDNTLTTPAVTDGSGVTTATIASTKAEAKTITATVGSLVLAEKPVVTFVPGPVSASESLVAVNPADGLVANGSATSTITVTARDAFLNLIPNKTVVLSVAGAGDAAKNTLVQPAAPTSAAGIATGTLKSTWAEVKTVTATVDGVELDDHPTITFIPGPVSAATSTVVANPATNVVADGNALSTITITVLDAHSNPISGAAVTLTKSSADPTLSTPAATNSSGVTTATIKSTKAETVTITAKVGSTTLPSATVTFVPDVPDATKSTVSVSPATGVVANNIATATITATIRDANSNLISGATVAFASSNANDTLTPTSATSGENGVATATIASTKAEQKTLTVTVNGTLVIDVRPTVTFVPGPPSASISTATALADPVVADGNATSTITVTVLDEYANPISGKKVTLSATGSGNTIGQPANTGANGVTTGTIKSTVAETKTITATVDGSPAVVIAQKPVVTFIPGAVNPASTFTVDRTTGVVADSVDVVTASVTIEDLKGNLVPGAQVVFAATGTGNIFNPASGTVTTAADGTASITLASTKAEAKTISVTADGVALGTTRVVTFVAGPPTAENSTFTASPTSVLANNAAYAALTVTLRDAFNNPVPGQSVSLIATGSANKFTPVSGSTNASGAFLSKLQSSSVEKKRVLAETATFVLATEVTFFADPPVVVALSEPSGGGCVPITYSVKQLQAKRVDLVVEFRETASSSFVRATQAAGTSEGIYGITTSNAGVSHTFLWNTTADVPRRAITGGTVKVTPYINGVPGTPLTASISEISNRLSFHTATQIASGYEPVAIAVADLNGDAKLDLITANPFTVDSTTGDRLSPDQIMVLLGNANGSFATAKPYLSESSGTPAPPDAIPVAIAPFDFDLDGDIDLAVANSARNDVSIFINDGAGVFTPPKYPELRPAFTVGDAPRALIAADLDLDGRRDLAVAHSSGVTVLLSASLYGTPFDHVVGANPSSLVSGDFNRDGLPDLAVANEGSNNVSVLLGLGTGDFAPAVEYAVGTNPSGVAAGDFNADGILDLATSNRGSNDASVLLGTGTGAFGAAQNFKTGLDPLVPVAPASIGVADLDGDGALDLVVANELENTLSVLLGDGMGGFVPETRPLANGQPVSAAIGDFNGDSKPDLAAAAWDADAVQVILNSRPRRCDEGFDTASNAEIGPAPQAVASGDFNGDGKPDIAVIDGTEVNLRVLLGTGNGSYRPSTPVAIPGGAGNHIVAADFNADGKLDVATPNVLGATFFSGNGSGGFTSPSPTTNGMPPTALAAGDFNGDDKLDLATTVESGFVEVYLFTSSFGKLSTTYVCNGRPVCTPTHLTIADFDRDGREDIAFVDLANVRVLFGDGSGGFTEPIDFTAGSAPSFVMSADFNADGFADLAVASEASGTVHLLAGDGNGGFSAGPALAVGTAPRWLTADRMNGDAHLDLVVGFSGERATKVLPGNGDMTFGAATAWDLAASPVAVATADFDGDGATDIAAVVASASPRVTTLLGNGDGTFPMPATYAAAGSPHKVFSADFDRDGALDLGVSALTGNHVRLFPGNADGTLAAALSTGASSPGAAAHADLNADGVLDLVVASATTGKLLVMFGDGAGLFAAPVEYAFPGTSPAPSAVAVGDFNRDGALDVVVANGAANNVCFYYGAGDGALGAATDCTVVGDLPVAIAIGDFDGNGRLDVATANSGIHNVGILLGHDGSQYPANFEPLRSFTAGTYPVGIVAIDLDRNGKLDLVTANKNGDSISVLAGLGNGNFSPHVQYAAPGSPTGIFASDLNDDGKPDILVPIVGNGVALFPNNGTGTQTFAAPVGYYLDADVYDLADFDRDGQPDLGFARTLSDRVGLCMGL